MEPYGLSQALKIDQKEAKAFIDKYFEKFPGVKRYFARITKQLDEKGYVNTFLGRKRYFPSWNNMSGFQKKVLFREAINMPIQGGTSEVIKLAMNNIFSYLRKNSVNATMLLQIHDELIFEVDSSLDLEKFCEDIQGIMTSAYDIGVPIKASMKQGTDLSFVK
jgi:DNA polymerase I